MAWKTVKGHPYYYRSKREGDGVRSEYMGGGEGGLLFAVLDAEDRQVRMNERADRHDAEANDREARVWFERIEKLAKAALLASGFHRHHRGPWRRRRNGE